MVCQCEQETTFVQKPRMNVFSYQTHLASYLCGFFSRKIRVFQLIASGLADNLHYIYAI